MGASDTEELMPVIDFTKLDALEEGYTDALKARGEAETAYQQAQKVDTYNAAQALREGKAAPTPKASPKKLDEATRNVEVAREALAQEKAEFVAMVERDRDALAATLAQRIDRAQADALRILDVVETCLRHKADQQAVLDWLANPSGRVGTRRTPGTKELKALGEVIEAGVGGATYKERQNRAVDEWKDIVERAKATVPSADRVPVFDNNLGHSTVPAIDAAIEREVARMQEAGEPLPEFIPKKWCQKLHLGNWAKPGAVPGLTPQQRRAAA